MKHSRPVKTSLKTSYHHSCLVLQRLFSSLLPLLFLFSSNYIITEQMSITLFDYCISLPIHCNYQLAHYSSFCRISRSILNRFQPHLQVQQCAIKHVSVNFSSFIAQAVSEHGAAATFFVTLCVPRCSESLDCLTLA